MKLPPYLALLLGLSIVQPTLGETGKRGIETDVIAGKALYQTYCQSCHQADGVGELPIPPLLRRPDYITAMPLNETSHAWHHGDEQLVELILDGVPRTKRMPTWRGALTEAQARQIIAYIKTFWSERILGCQGPKHMSCM